MKIKEIMLNNEKYLAPYATKDQDAVRLFGAENDQIRPNYYRDIDRIIYSLSYTRYIDKTQVFSRKNNDHISKRIIHVQFVSKIARTIARALSLNEDLTEAIALGHDIGHVPFGHLGESILNEISLRYNEGYFFHNVQSVRTLMYLEDNGRGKNLCLQTLDGILCHNGEFVNCIYRPRQKTQEDFLNDYHTCYQDASYIKKLVPMTLEGCVVRISDIIGYLGRDIEDAVQLGVLNKKEIPENITQTLGSNNREIINTIIKDIIKNSLGQNYIAMSPEIFKAVVDLKAFNYKNIYDHANTSQEKQEIKMMFNVLFDNLIMVLKNHDKTNNIYKVYLKDMDETYLKTTSDARKVIDYIAGMTDDYFTDEYNKIKKDNS